MVDGASDLPGFEASLDALAAPVLAQEDAIAAELLRKAAYGDGLVRLRAFQDSYRSHATPLAAGLERLRALRASRAFEVRPGILDGEIPGSGRMNGVDVSLGRIRSFATETLERAAGIYREGLATGFEAPLSDAGWFGGEHPRPFEDRYLLMRFHAVRDPGAYAALVRADGAWRRTGELMAEWWTERLRQARGARASRGTLDAFRGRLAATVALTRCEDVDVDYGPDAWLGEALDEAGLPEHTLDGCRKGVTWVNLRKGTVHARTGLDGVAEELGGTEPDTVPAPRSEPASGASEKALDVAAFLVAASVPDAVIRRVPGMLAVALPVPRPDGKPSCLLVTPSGSGLRIVDDGTSVPRSGPTAAGAEALSAAGVGWDAGTGVASLEMPGIDGVGTHLMAMARALVAAA